MIDLPSLERAVSSVMTNFSRRRFLKSLGTLTAGLSLFGRGALASPFFDPEEAADFNFLVAGDSLVWGQGLREEDKFYSLTKNWLEREVFGGARRVRLNVKAHSGATIRLSDEETRALREAGKDETKPYAPEITLSFPSIRAQIETARREYADARAVNLIMLTGGITEITVTEILNPFKNNEKLRADVVKYCREQMFELLVQTAQTFPDALIAVVGYYPIITRRTPMKRLVNDILEIYDTPRWLKPVINNPLKRRVLKGYRNRIIRRSEIWAENSTVELQKAVAALNAEFAAPRAVFIKPPFTEANGYGAEETLLWKIARKGKPEDDVYRQRMQDCRETLERLSEQTGLKYRARKCELSSVGHPNAAGARVIAQAVAENLKPFFQTSAVIE